MAYFTRLVMHYFRLVSVGVLGLLLTNSTVLVAGSKPIVTLYPNDYVECNTQHSRLNLGSIAIPLSGQITSPSLLNGLWLASHLGYASWNWLDWFRGEKFVRLNPEGSVELSYYHDVKPQLQVHTYGRYHWSKGREGGVWYPSRHVGSVGIGSYSAKTRQITNFNLHILMPGQEQNLGRQDQWRVDGKIGSPIPFFIEKTFLLGGPYYKCIQTPDSQQNYWGGSVEILLPLLNGSVFAKYSYDQYDRGRFLFGWFSGTRPATPLTPENFM